VETKLVPVVVTLVGVVVVVEVVVEVVVVVVVVGLVVTVVGLPDVVVVVVVREVRPSEVTTLAASISLISSNRLRNATRLNATQKPYRNATQHKIGFRPCSERKNRTRFYLLAQACQAP